MIINLGSPDSDYCCYPEHKDNCFPKRNMVFKTLKKSVATYSNRHKGSGEFLRIQMQLPTFISLYVQILFANNCNYFFLFFHCLIYVSLITTLLSLIFCISHLNFSRASVCWGWKSPTSLLLSEDILIMMSWSDNECLIIQVLLLRVVYKQLKPMKQDHSRIFLFYHIL